jgi:hypothetical protein
MSSENISRYKKQELKKLLMVSGLPKTISTTICLGTMLHTRN